MNSIQGNLTEQTYVAGVVQAVRGLAGSGRHLIVVEGEDDRQFYSPFLDSDHTQIFVEGTCGYYNAIAAAITARYSDRLTMIKDADFDHLMGTKPLSDNILLTDFHDAEMFLTAVDIPASIASAYDCGVIVSEVEVDIRSLSMVKWYNMANSCKLSFKKKCKISKLYDGNAAITFQTCLTQLACDSRNAGKAVVAQSDMEIFATANSGADWRQYTNGHDFLHAIATKINRLKTKAYSELDIRKTLEADYTQAYFQHTSLYAGLMRRGVTVNSSICK